MYLNINGVCIAAHVTCVQRDDSPGLHKHVSQLVLILLRLQSVGLYNNRCNKRKGVLRGRRGGVWGKGVVFVEVQWEGRGLVGRVEC